MLHIDESELNYKIIRKYFYAEARETLNREKSRAKNNGIIVVWWILAEDIYFEAKQHSPSNPSTVCYLDQMVHGPARKEVRPYTDHILATPA